MELYIGGYAQGKTEYVRRLHAQENPVIFNHLHLWIREMLERGENPESALAAWLAANPDGIIICDELGNGIVPMERSEREYRERVGRILITLAERAARVERVVCGIGQRLK